MKKLILAILLAGGVSAFAEDVFVGEYKGECEAPKGSYFQMNPTVHMQISRISEDMYRIKVLPFICRRPYIYATCEVKSDGKADIVLDGAPFTTEYNFSKISGVVKTDGSAELVGYYGKTPIKMKLEKFDRVSPTMGLKPPEGANLLIGEGNLDKWREADGAAPVWEILGEVVEIKPDPKEEGKKRKNRTIYTKEKFSGDLRLHLEYKLPEEYDKIGQGRGNSGLFFGDIELQILDSFHSDGLWDEAGALYRFSPPQVNAALPAETWQTYDVEYIAAKFKDGKIVSYPRLTVWHNGVKVQGDIEVPSCTSHRQDLVDNYKFAEGPISISLQDHDHNVQFRNMWVCPLSADDDKNL